jgi:hypothetical protein
MTDVEFLEAEDITGHYEQLAQQGLRPPLAHDERVYVIRVIADGKKWAKIEKYPLPLDSPELIEFAKRDALKIAKKQFGAKE